MTGKTCDYLLDGSANEQLWQLYWCDFKYCGVYIDPQLSHQDRTL